VTPFGEPPTREVNVYVRFTSCPHCGSVCNRRYYGEFGSDYSHVDALLQLLCYTLQGEHDEPYLDPHPPGQACAQSREGDA